MQRAAAAVVNARRFNPRPAKVDEVQVYRKERGWGKNLSRAEAAQQEARKARQQAEWARRRAKRFAGLQPSVPSPSPTRDKRRDSGSSGSGSSGSGSGSDSDDDSIANEGQPTTPAVVTTAPDEGMAAAAVLALSPAADGASPSPRRRLPRKTLATPEAIRAAPRKPRRLSQLPVSTRAAKARATRAAGGRETAGASTRPLQLRSAMSGTRARQAEVREAQARARARAMRVLAEKKKRRAKRVTQPRLPNHFGSRLYITDAYGSPPAEASPGRHNGAGAPAYSPQGHALAALASPASSMPPPPPPPPGVPPGFGPGMSPAPAASLPRSPGGAAFPSPGMGGQQFGVGGVGGMPPDFALQLGAMSSPGSPPGLMPSAAGGAGGRKPPPPPMNLQLGSPALSAQPSPLGSSRSATEQAAAFLAASGASPGPATAQPPPPPPRL